MSPLAAGAVAVPAVVSAALLAVRELPSPPPVAAHERRVGAEVGAEVGAGFGSGVRSGVGAGVGAGVGDERVVVRVAATLAVGGGLLLLVGGPAGTLVALVGAVICWWTVGRLEPPSVRRRRERLAAAVPHAVDLLAACLSAGLSPGLALEQISEAVAAPLSEELAAVTSRIRLGVDPATLWRDLARHPQLGGVGRALARATESGASVSEAMLRLADDLRRRTRAETENRARAVGVRAALPLGLCLLPAFVLVGVVPLVVGSLSVLL